MHHLKGVSRTVTYGKNHEITVTEGTTISATNKDGIAVSFDFGSNELSDYIEYRGSYILAKNFDAFEKNLDEILLSFKKQILELFKNAK